MIWIIGGTKDARELAVQLADSGYQVIVTTATPEGASLLDARPGLSVQTGRLTQDQMCLFIKQHTISLVIDASHPYATEVSLGGIGAAQKCTVPYLRFERPGSGADSSYFEGSYEQIAGFLAEQEGNILLTIGSNTLAPFSRIDPKRLFVRVLPVASSIEKCRMLGIALDHIIAIQGPFSRAFNKALFAEYKINYLVTKDSGSEGGVPEKTAAAAELGIKVLLVQRPAVDYPLVFSTFETLIEYITKSTYK